MRNFWFSVFETLWNWCLLFPLAPIMIRFPPAQLGCDVKNRSLVSPKKQVRCQFSLCTLYWVSFVLESNFMHKKEKKKSICNLQQNNQVHKYVYAYLTSDNSVIVLLFDKSSIATKKRFFSKWDIFNSKGKTYMAARFCNTIFFCYILQVLLRFI